MRNLTLFILLLLSTKIFAGETNNLISNLEKVNREWSKQADGIRLVVNIQTNNNTFDDWIATHLMLVEQTLRARDVSNLTFEQKQNRFRLLNELNGYWHSRAFPVNDYVAYQTPVFIDRTGNHCAVGYLMQQSGAEELAQRINANEKFAYVHQIKTPGVKQWADDNGFTVDELAWIQPAYPTQIPCEDLDGGLNGTVNAVVAEPNGQVVYVAGSFTETTGGVTCNNIAAWFSGFAGWDWMPLGTGVNGTIHAMYLHNNKLYVGGNFTMAGGVAAKNIAAYDISLGQWQAVGNLDSTVRALTVYGYDLYAGGDFTGFVSKWTGSNWQDVTAGFIYGEGVRALDVFDSKLVIGGNFELATGALRKHVATYDGAYMGSLGFGTLTPVNDFEIHEGNLYAACDAVAGNDTCALAVFENDDWNILLKSEMGIMSGFSGNAIYKIVSAGSSLLAAGDFGCSWGMLYGSHLMELRRETYLPDTTEYLSTSPLAIPDQPVHDLMLVNNTLYFGGAFVINAFSDTLNHVGTIELTSTAINEPEKEAVKISVFPNPSSDVIRIQPADNRRIQWIEVYDATGRRILAESTGSGFETTVVQTSPRTYPVSIHHLEAGFYTVRTLIDNKWSHSNFVKH